MVICFILLNYCIIGIGHAMLYEPDAYTCRHMARDIEDTLESMGIDVTIVTGRNHNNSKGHMWVKIFGVDFNSVTLMPYYPTTYKYRIYEFKDYEYYKIWRKNL